MLNAKLWPGWPFFYMISFPLEKLSICGTPFALFMSGKAKKKASTVHSSAPASPAGKTPGVANSRSPESESRPARLNDCWLAAGVCLFLAAIIWLVFGQTLGHEFVNYDDNVYVYENPVVQKGLTLEGIVSAFTRVYSSNWHPLTIMSHMLDCQFYGLSPDGHHLTNILLHTATVILLFLVLRRVTGLLWRSAFVAAVFAIHPLRVESVAWVAERKDVLSGLFFMLTLGAYIRYVRRPFSIGHYLPVVFLFALGLMCKPMLVTLPLVLLLLDYWPLNRLRTPAATGPIFRFSGWSVPRRLLFEKLPLFGLAVASCVVTIFAQHEALQSFEKFSLPLNMGNALVSYVAYLSQMFWPSGMAVLYPFAPKDVGVSKVVLSLVLLAGISGGVFILRRRPYFLTGWLWYLIMLVPVIGVVQVGAQARADRYTYLPQIGLYLLLTWAAADLCAGWRHRRWMLGSFATAILAALIFCARTQTSYWRNSESLWTHTIASTSDNYIGHNNLSIVLVQKGQVDEGIVHSQKAQQINPDYADARNNLGIALVQMGHVDEAIIHYQKALRINPDSAEVHYNFGIALLKKGLLDEAIAHYQKALEINPDYADACNNLGIALLQKGNVDEAIIHYQKALRIKPDNAEAHNNLGSALSQKGEVNEAIAQYQKALQIKPGYADAHYNLGNALLKMGNVDEAIAHCQTALQIKPGYAEACYQLGNALFQKGDLDKAIVHYQTTLQINPDYAEAHNNLAIALVQKGQVDEAITHCQKSLQIKPGFAEAHYNLGNVLLQKGNVDEAIIHYQQALKIKPDYAEAHNNLGSALCQKGKVDEAITHCQQALQIKPGYAEAHNNLGSVLYQKGKVDEAIIHYQKALQINPAYADAHYNLGNALLKMGKVDEAIAHYQKTLQINPDNAKAHYNLGNVLLQKSKVDEAIAHYQKALQIKPDYPNALNNLAWQQATCPDVRIRDGVQAVKYAERACELTHYGVPPFVGTLAAAYAEAGRFDEAIAAAEKACGLAAAGGEQKLLEKNQKLLVLYRAHQPYHEAVEKFVPAAP
jgi:protein O-mannosyl-transferase